MPLENDRSFQMRTSDDFLGKLDDWRRAQPALPSRAEAIRILVEIGIATTKTAAPPITPMSGGELR